jgi:hypothetical protein
LKLKSILQLNQSVKQTDTIVPLAKGDGLKGLTNSDVKPKGTFRKLELLESILILKPVIIIRSMSEAI